MDKSSKYFYIQSSIRPYISLLMKWNANFSVDVEENVNSGQRISLYIDKFSEKEIEMPGNSEYERVRHILKKVFLDKYNLAIQRLSDYELLDGEFYLMEHSDHFYQIEYYSTDKKTRRNIKIDFRDFINVLRLEINSSSNFGRRPTVRKKGVPITPVQFMQFLNLSLQFSYDPDSYFVFLNSFINNFYKLVNGEEKIEGFIISAEESFNKITEQLENRKKFIESRLIEIDNDPINERIRLRGEIDGIVYAINAVKINK